MVTTASFGPARRQGRKVSVPPAIAAAWTLAEWEPRSIEIFESATDPYGDVGITPEALFDLFSTARSAPAQTYYVATTGNDSTGQGTEALPWLSIHKAVTVANARGLPAKISVAAGEYVRANNPSNGNTVLPTVDLAFIATGGRVVTGTFDTFTNPTADVTYTDTYSAVLTNVDRIMDRTLIDRFGNITDLVLVGSEAICNRTPNSWFYATGTNTYYINRADGAAPTATNTRIYRSSVATFRATSPVSIFFGGATAVDGWDMEGAHSGGILVYAPTTTPTTNKAVVCSNSSFRYGGGRVHTAAPGVGVNSVHGIAAFFNCRADADWTDGFNFHNTASATAVNHILTVNCSGNDSGRGSAASCNGWTCHEDVVAIDVAGVYRGNRGGSVRDIDTSKAFLVGTVIANDLGDVALGGSITPTAIRTDNTAVIYADGAVLDMPAGTLGLDAQSGTSIFHRNMGPFRCANRATGTISAY